MLRVRCGDVEHIHLWIVHDLVVGAVRACQAVLGGKGLRALARTARNSPRLGAIEVWKILDHQGCDAPRSDDAPSNDLEICHRRPPCRCCRILLAIDEMKIGMKISHQ